MTLLTTLARIQPVGTQVAGVWDDYALTPVGTSITAVWDNQAHVHQDITALWRVHVGTGTDITAVWKVRSELGISLEALWDIRALVHTDVHSLWNIQARVGVSVTASWEDLLAVGVEYTFLWRTRGYHFSRIDGLVEQPEIVLHPTGRRLKQLSAKNLEESWGATAMQAPIRTRTAGRTTTRATPVRLDPDGHTLTP